MSMCIICYNLSFILCMSLYSMMCLLSFNAVDVFVQYVT